MALSRRSKYALLLCCVAALTALRAPQELRVAGEFGLYVWESRDSVHVQWLTQKAAPGKLQVMVSGKPHFNTNTPIGIAHHVAFRKPKGDSFELAYGEVTPGSPLQKTIIYDRPPAVPASSAFTDSIYVFGDTHGEFDTVVQLLKHARLINDKLQWTGGKKQIVFLGDVLDRGPDATRLLWYLYGLEREAEASGGRLHLVLGNHEIMVMLGDLRYVHPKEAHIAQLHNVNYARFFHSRASTLGRWLASKPAVLKLGDLLFAHGGVSSDYLKESPASLARTVHQTIRSDLFVAHTDTTIRVRVDSATIKQFDRLFWGERSVFWYRGYAQSDTLDAELTGTLNSFGVQALVVGHTPQPQILQRYQGKLIIAHPRRPGGELLLITGQGSARKLYRLLPDGTVEAVAQ